ncbi:MAG: hypothetical protein LBS77_06300 [Desulfovibrio sp.]|nr:hypothetical protein [Desulfovibrio sp.]
MNNLSEVLLCYRLQQNALEVRRYAFFVQAAWPRRVRSENPRDFVT